MVIVEHSQDARIPVRSQLISINDHSIDDFLEFEFYNDRAQPRQVAVASNGRTQRIAFRPEEDIPVTLQAPEYRTCMNDCAFCFIKGLPSGLRTSLYVRDDDYRLSFLFGNFLSLTNITDKDIARIARLRLTPLYVSVHATNPELRIAMFKNERAGSIIEQLRSLIRHRITLHCQIVVIPGLNDSAHLDRSIDDLGALYPGVDSIGIIPVGRARYAPFYPLVTARQAIDIVNLVAARQREFRAQHGKGVVYAADEIFIKSGIDIPSSSYYDDMPQIENGIGMVRSFLDEISAIRTHNRIKGRVLFVTSHYAAQCITMLQQRLIQNRMIAAENIEVCTIANTFFGPTVTVSGLLGADDIERSIRPYAHRYNRIVLPPNCTNDDGDFIDNGRITVDTFVAPRSIKELLQWLRS
jgi:putative radical SAM enzyme (TIGR03279 family)